MIKYSAILGLCSAEINNNFRSLKQQTMVFVGLFLKMSNFETQFTTMKKN